MGWARPQVHRTDNQRGLHPSILKQDDIIDLMEITNTAAISNEFGINSPGAF